MRHLNLLSYWGSEGLRKYTAASLQRISIPLPAKAFLESIGMPIIHDPLFQFQPEEAPFLMADQEKGFFTIGTYDISPICVKEGDGGLYWYDPDNHTARFMNTGVEHFVLVLTLYVEMLKKCRNIPEDQQKPIVDEAKRQMKLIDREAFASEDFYWSIIFEEIEYELS